MAICEQTLLHYECMGVPAENKAELIFVKMALANVLKSECADFEKPFAFGCAFNDADVGFGETSGDSHNFAVQRFEGEEDGVERKIEFLHGTTTLAFKVSLIKVSVNLELVKSGS